MTQTLITERMIEAALEGWEYERSEAHFRGLTFNTRNGLEAALKCALGLLTIREQGKPEEPPLRRIERIGVTLKEIDAITYALIHERRALTPPPKPEAPKRNAWISNRYIAERLLVWLDDPLNQLGCAWAVIDAYGPQAIGAPSKYGAEFCTLEIHSYSDGGWVLVDCGMYLRHPTRKDGRKGKVRIFKTVLDAAIAAEQEDGVGR